MKFMKKKSLCMITFPISKAGIIPTSNLLEILCSIFNDIYLITGNDGYNYFKEDDRFIIFGIKHEKGSSIFTRIINYFLTQLKISYKMMKISRKIDLWIFFIGGDILLLPMLIAKLSGKKVVLALAGSSYNSAVSSKNILTKLIKKFENINRKLADCIILYSPNLIKEWNLEKYVNKISIAYEHFLNFDIFKIKNNINERKNLIGYIGRFSKEKGIMNFLSAIYIENDKIEKKQDLKFFIGGDGEEREKIIKFLNEKKLNNNVILTGWISHNDLGNYLNELKLLIIPSYSEGLPNILLEAMACGTPVLASAVGTIPDIIEDGKTGFIMESNDSECIAKNIERVLKIQNLDEIVKNARGLIEKKYTYKFVMTRYKKIFNKLLEKSE
jgi:glycosyltransferase involved in cell wall biosynthesis